VTYVNSCLFTSLLLFDVLKRKIPCRWSIPILGRGARSKQYAPIEDVEEEDQVFSKPVNGHTVAATEKMDVLQTAKLGFTFGLLWVKTSPVAGHAGKMLIDIVCGIFTDYKRRLILHTDPDIG